MSTIFTQKQQLDKILTGIGLGCNWGMNEKWIIWDTFGTHWGGILRWEDINLYSNCHICWDCQIVDTQESCLNGCPNKKNTVGLWVGLPQNQEFFFWATTPLPTCWLLRDSMKKELGISPTVEDCGCVVIGFGYNDRILKDSSHICRICRPYNYCYYLVRKRGNRYGRWWKKE